MPYTDILFIISYTVYDVYDILYKISYKLENSGGPSVTERHRKTFK